MKVILSDRAYLKPDETLLERFKVNLCYESQGSFANAPIKYTHNWGPVMRGTYWIPVERLDLLQDYELEIVDKRTLVPTEIPEPFFTLREDQQQVLDAVGDTALINAAPGWGKTVTALAVAHKLGQKTLIVCTTTTIRDMWVNEVEKFMDFTPGIVGSGKNDISQPITVGNIQTLTRNADKFKDKFGTIIFDECFDYETLVTLADGTTKKIGTIVNQKLTPEVRSYNESTGRWENKKVLRHFKNPQKTLRKLQLGNTSLRCTENHNIYVKSDRGVIKKQAKDLQIGDLVLGDSILEEYSLVEYKGYTEVPATGGNRYNIEVEDNHNYIANGKLVSNCHHTPATTFSKLLLTSKARYKIGLSGTLHRRDGMHSAFKDFFGFNVLQPEINNTVPPTVHVYKSGCALPGNMLMPWADRVTQLTENEMYRREVLALAKIYCQMGHKTILVSDRIEFLTYVHENTELRSALFIGDADLERRTEILGDMTNEGLDLICASQSLFSEGVSQNNLSCMILGSPISDNRSLLSQLAGRIMRIHEGKLDPILVDMSLSSEAGRSQARKRKAIYKMFGWKTEDVDLQKLLYRANNL